MFTRFVHDSRQQKMVRWVFALAMAALLLGGMVVPGFSQQGEDPPLNANEFITHLTRLNGQASSRQSAQVAASSQSQAFITQMDALRGKSVAVAADAREADVAHAANDYITQLDELRRQPPADLIVRTER